MTFSVNVNNNLFYRRELKDNVCYIFRRQMYSWKLPSVNSSLNGCIIFNWNSDVLCVFKMKTWRVQYDFENVFFSIPNLAPCKTFKSKYDAFWIFYFKFWRVRKKWFQNLTSFKNIFSKIWVLSCFSSSDWMKIFSVNVNNNLFWGRKLSDKVCCSFSRQKHNWKLTEFN